MRFFKLAAAGATAASMMLASSAIAARPTSSAALLAPVKGVRSATALKHKSNQAGDSAAIGYVLAAGMAAGIVYATIEGTKNDSHYPPVTPASPG
ncbi:MAG: hypothetical protein ACTHMG_09835 [Sphingomonas sp.]